MEYIPIVGILAGLGRLFISLLLKDEGPDLYFSVSKSILDIVGFGIAPLAVDTTVSMAIFAQMFFKKRHHVAPS